MLRIIIGLIMILFGFELKIADKYVVGLIPDFVGYLFLFFGMKAEQDKCVSYKRDKLFMLPFAIYSYAVYLGNLYGLIPTIKIPYINLNASRIFEFVSMLMVIYTTYIIYKGLKMAEDSFSVELRSKRVMYIWRVRVLCSVMENLTFMVWDFCDEGYESILSVVGPMYLVMSVANIVAGIVMAVYVTQVAIIYSELKRNNRLKRKGER